MYLKKKKVRFLCDVLRTLLHFVGFCTPRSLLFSEIDNPNDWADILTYIHLHGTFICLPHLFICLPPLTNICQGG